MKKQEIMLKRVRYLRKNNTRAEDMLWYYLKARRLNGYKFRRQVSIGYYIVDFVCEWRKVIIELDGGQHGDTKKYDDVRTIFLESQGYKVIRFWNNEVMFEVKTVLEVILCTLENR